MGLVKRCVNKGKKAHILITVLSLVSSERLVGGLRPHYVMNTMLSILQHSEQFVKIRVTLTPLIVVLAGVLVPYLPPERH
jgi:hypothetical protein